MVMVMVVVMGSMACSRGFFNSWVESLVEVGCGGGCDVEAGYDSESNERTSERRKGGGREGPMIGC